MADKKASAETAASALDGSEIVRIVQGGASVRSTTQDVADLAFTGSAISALDAAATLDGTEVVPGVQGAGDVKITADQLAHYTLYTALDGNTGSATTPLSGAETVYLWQGSDFAEATTQDIADLAAGGSPGGSDTHVQFNSGGTAFGGDSGFVYAGSGFVKAVQWGFTDYVGNYLSNNGTGGMLVSIQAAKQYYFTPNGLQPRNGKQLFWGPAGNPDGVTPDVGISRSGVGIAQITDGSTGTGQLLFFFPSADPHIVGAWWDNGTVLVRSAG